MKFKEKNKKKKIKIKIKTIKKLRYFNLRKKIIIYKK